MLLVINFGSQVAHLIARRIRDQGAYSEIVPYSITADKIRKLNPKGIILSGGPNSVYDKGSPLINKDILKLGIPILGICYGHQLIGHLLGKVEGGKSSEYGKTKLKVSDNKNILKGFDKQEHVWMSHGDLITRLPENFKVVASTPHCKYAAIENVKDKIYGVQFHPEVTHTKKGTFVFKNFLFNICKASKNWNIPDLKNKFIDEVKKKVKDDYVIMGVSGGVDSTVAAILTHEAIGDKIYCVFIDHGLIRKDEAEEVKNTFKKFKFKHFYTIDASKIFLKKLKGVLDPEEKRKIIANTFIEVFEKKVEELEKKNPKIKFLGQGTIYPDRIESAEASKEAHKIKSHHNVVLPKGMKLKLVEPLKELYKDEVRILGKELMIPKKVIGRHPFPGPGLAIRILGEVTSERLDILREVDHIYISKLKESGYYDKTWQAFAALLPVKSVGVMGDGRTYEYVVTLRAVTSVDAMTADWAKLPYSLLEEVSNRIINEVKGVNRVLYDISQKPPATIEYE